MSLSKGIVECRMKSQALTLAGVGMREAGHPLKLAQQMQQDHSRAVFHLDRAHPAQGSTLTDVRTVAQQTAATTLEVLLIPERETGGHCARHRGAAHAAAV